MSKLPTEFTLNITKKMSGKMQHFRSINTSPLSNDYCNTKCGFVNTCYSKFLLKTARKNCNPAFERNNKILSTMKITADNIPVNFFSGELVRFHAHGELINDLHFENFCTIAELNPQSSFTLWTKRLELVEPNLGLKPKNLRIIYSTHDINPETWEIPKGCVGVFNVFTADYIKDHDISINCSQNCALCQRCYTLKNFVTNEVIKRGNMDNKRYEKVKR